MSDDRAWRRPLPPAPKAVVAMPGTGSDGDYAARAFGPLAAFLDVPLIAVDPAADGVVAGHHRALTEAGHRFGPVLAAGVSIGACAAVEWAAQTTVRGTVGECAGVVAALPPWVADETGGQSPSAAVAARASATSITDRGLADAIDEMAASSPDWLADELTRSWSAIGDDLPAQLLEAARATVPTSAHLRSVRVPVVVVAVADDPLHPVAVAARWGQLISTSMLSTISFEEWGADPGALGRAAVASGFWRSSAR